MKQSRSARGDIVDFDLIAIKDQLANIPVPVDAASRRRFIDEKTGVRFKEVIALDETQATVVNRPAAKTKKAGTE